jgi:hypothetical protein
MGTDKGLPRKIRRALDLLNESERSRNHRNKIALFNRGMNLLDECVEDFPDREHIIIQHKVAPTVNLLRWLCSEGPRCLGSDDFVAYYLTFECQVEGEMRQLVETNQELRECAAKFLQLWAGELPARAPDRSLISPA